MVLSAKQRDALKERIDKRALNDDDFGLLREIVDRGLTQRREAKPEPESGKSPKARSSSGSSAQGKGKGHGRLSEQDYTGARDVKVPSDHKPGDPCPHCNKGHLYRNRIKKLITLMAQAPIDAIRYWVEQFRCSRCGQTVDTEPAEARWGKCHPSACAGVALMKFGLGVPAKRLETWQRHLGIPLPDATQHDMVGRLQDSVDPIFTALEGLLAQSDLFHLDDTGMPVLSMIAENKLLGEGERYGMHATGVIGHHDEHQICLYYFGRDHAGENLGTILDQRPKHLSKPLQMGDASSRNTKHEHDTIEANCQSHAVRKFKDDAETDPSEAGYILSLLSKVFANDREAREMSKEQRLAFHQVNSGPVMDKLYHYLCALLDEKQVEPNGTLAQSINYMLKRWEGFTRFLHIPGAPLDNNIIERALKLVIRLRKNAGFFKTAKSARNAAVIMSILATAAACGANPMDYLTAVQIHESDVIHQPQRWLPWNYTERMRELATT